MRLAKKRVADLKLEGKALDYESKQFAQTYSSGATATAGLEADEDALEEQEVQLRSLKA